MHHRPAFRISSLSRGRAQWTRVAHDDASVARGVHRDIGSRSLDLRAREASSVFGGPGAVNAVAHADAEGEADGVARLAADAGVRDLRSVSEDLRCDVVIKARRDSVKATDAGGAR